jgi:hypothetical protein
LSKVKEIKRLCGGVVYYAAQASAQIDAEIGQKDHLWMETNSLFILVETPPDGSLFIDQTGRFGGWRQD